MTLDEALVVMNRFRHDGIDTWERAYTNKTPDSEQCVNYGTNDPCANLYSPWECEAIAEKYLREEAENGNG